MVHKVLCFWRGEKKKNKEKNSLEITDEKKQIKLLKMYYYRMSMCKHTLVSEDSFQELDPSFLFDEAGFL